MNALHAGVGSQGKPGLIHCRHGGNSQINSCFSGRGHHPGAADGGVRLALQKQGVDRVVLGFPGHQLYKFQVVGKGVLYRLRIREGRTAFIDDGAAEAVNPGSGIVGGTVLLHKAVAPPTGVVLHVSIEFLGGGGHLPILHIAAVVHKQQRLKVQRKLIQGVLVSGGVQSHGQILCQSPVREQRFYGRQNAHFGKNTDFVMGKDK